jgi:transcription initiation factor TFIID subunit TAF12
MKKLLILALLISACGLMAAESSSEEPADANQNRSKSTKYVDIEPDNPIACSSEYPEDC